MLLKYHIQNKKRNYANFKNRGTNYRIHRTMNTVKQSGMAGWLKIIRYEEEPNTDMNK